MTTAESDLVGSIRAELAAIDPHRRCCRAAESAGLSGAFEPRRRNLARVALRLSRPRPGDGGAASRVSVGPDAGPWPAAAATSGDEPAATANGVAAASGVVAAAAGPFDWGRAAEHCRIAYLRGRFLAHGSLSLASGRTHLEFVLPADEARTLCDRLAEFDMPAHWRLRRGRGVVTWKSVETVTTFLKVVGGGAALLELESRQVSRSVRGDLNRVINAESANLGRAVAASADQIDAIEVLVADGRLADQPYVVRLVADARLEEPEATFTELATRLGLHRSSVQRALDRIQRLAIHPDERSAARNGCRGGPRRSTS
jgi:hypothetical protein